MIALLPGSFDPPHLGHLDAIRRLARLVEVLWLGVGVNPAKQAMLPAERRIALLSQLTVDLPNVRIEAYSGATVHFARLKGITILVRGIRAASEAEHEQAMALVHRGLGLETLFVLSDPALVHVSSSTVRMVRAAGLPLDGLVPPLVIEALR